MLAHPVASAAHDAVGVASRRYADFHVLRLERQQFTTRVMAVFSDDSAPAGDSGGYEQVFSTVFGLAMLLQMHDRIPVQCAHGIEYN
jgi:hypothetical protein